MNFGPSRRNRHCASVRAGVLRIFAACSSFTSVPIFRSSQATSFTGHRPGALDKCPVCRGYMGLSLIHISEPTRRTPISYAVFCLKKKKREQSIQKKKEKKRNKNRSNREYRT